MFNQLKLLKRWQKEDQTELSWSEKDFDEATLNKVRKYSSKKGL